MPNWLEYSLQTKNFTLFWSHMWNHHIQVNERLKKVKEKRSIIKFDTFILSFIFFVPMSQTISVINRFGTCYFIHTSNGEDYYDALNYREIKEICKQECFNK